MEIGLKERLIGAAVLVILGIIIIPFFLKGPAPDTGTSQPLNPAPSAATAVQQYSLPLTAGTAAAPASATAAPAVATKPAASVHPIARPTAAPAAGNRLVQAGSYGSEANADKVAGALQARGFHASISRFSKSGRSYFRVRVGPYADRAAAEKAATAVAKASGAKTEVVPND
jgi:cell division septation protein DedD